MTRFKYEYPDQLLKFQIEEHGIYGPYGAIEKLVSQFREALTHYIEHETYLKNLERVMEAIEKRNNPA